MKNYLVVIGDIYGQIKIFNPVSPFLELKSFQAHSSKICRITQSPFPEIPNHIATGSSDATVKVWDSSSSLNWILIRTYSQHSSYVAALEWLDKDTLASCGGVDGLIKIWSLSTGQTKRTININGEVTTLKLLKNGIHLAAVTGWYSNFNIQIFNINDGSLVGTLKGHTSSIKDLVQMSANILASSSQDQTIRIWDLATQSSKFTLKGHTSWTTGLKQISSQILASASPDKTIKLWDTTSGQLLRTLTGHTDQLYFSLDLLNNNGGQTSLVSGGYDKTIKVWDWSTGNLLSSVNTNSVIWSLVVLNKSISKYLFIERG